MLTALRHTVPTTGLQLAIRRSKLSIVSIGVMAEAKTPKRMLTEEAKKKKKEKVARFEFTSVV